MNSNEYSKLARQKRLNGCKYLCLRCHQGFTYLSSGEIEGGAERYCPNCYSSGWIEVSVPEKNDPIII